MTNPPGNDGAGTPEDLSGELSVVADRLSSLADTAELMNDHANASRFRDAAAIVRLEAMGLLDV